MELLDSSRGDLPEKNPTPAQTEGLCQERVSGSYLMELEAGCFERLSKKKVEMRAFLDIMVEKASSALETSVNWEEIDAHYTSMGDSLKKREMEVELKQKSVLERILEFEKKEERLVNVEEREKKIELFEKSISLILKQKEEEIEMKQILESSVLRLVLEKNGEEVIEEKRQEVKSCELEKEKEAELVENSLKQLEIREKELRLLDGIIKEKLTALEMREEKFEANQKEKAEEMELKRMLLELKEKKLEEREKEVELKQMELEELSKQAKTSKRSSVVCTDDIHPAKRHKRLVREHIHDGEGNEIDSASSIETRETNEGETEVSVSKVGVDEDLEPLICADSEFNDFKKTMSSFVVDKIWALYDPLDHMPRLYGRIRKINKSRLSLLVKWLEPKEDESVPVACGKFMYGKNEMVSHLVFSHEANPIMNRYIISLNPRKGETWALFRDWSKSWKNNPKQHKPPYRYDFVEILFDFNKQYGIGVSYLGKVEGFRSVFEHAGKDGVVSVMISPEEIHRFSHRVPSFRLNGEEKEGVPVGSFELDPAAIPYSTLNVKEEEESEREIENCCTASEVEDQDGSRREIPINLD